MIQANELRLNNIVQVNGILGIVEWIQKDSISVRYFEIQSNLSNGIITHESKLTPIPITEEILVKCGFEWEDIKTHTDKTTRGLYKGILMMLPTNNEWWYAAPFGYPLHIERTMYLHQLQNLYYAFTGEELVYTP
jgi:hypothetical protein